MTQTALVTGANRGIGYEITRQLANHGWQVIIAARTLNKATKATNQLVASGLDAAHFDQVALDLNDADSIAQAGDDVAQHHPDLTLLVNNAGIAGDMEKRALATTPADLEATLKVNLLGTMAVIQAMAPTLRTNHGRIANLTGPGATTVWYHPLAYSVSKYALNGLIQNMAADFIQHQEPLSIFGLFPGGVSTDINHHQQGRFMKSVEEAGQQIVDVLLDGQDHNGQIIGPDGKVLSQVPE
jgi:NAD(P)-dependent dehydrogenase (short-subunit alcohol dehydrogenase family)